MEWVGISPEVKDLIKKCLTKSNKRLRAYEVLSHKWMKMGLKPKKDYELKFNRLEAFSKFHKFKKSVLVSIASQLDETQIGSLKNLFFDMDQDEDGVISFDEFKSFILALEKDRTEHELKFVFNGLDLSKNGCLDYNGMYYEK